jgi:ABC-type oligopeptide transport system substrate-binding subunit
MSAMSFEPPDLPDYSALPSWSPQPARRGRPTLGGIGTAALLLAMVVVAALALVSVTPRAAKPALTGARPSGADVVILGGQTAAWDPARIGDAASAETLAQVWEGLTAFDAQAHVQPALAQSWDLADGGRKLTFQLRPGITFSDGSPITADDVVRSWLRVIDPATPSPLSGLLGDVVNARDYMAGKATASEVGIKADGGSVVVTFERPASWFPAAAASPTLAIVPAGLPASASTPVLPDGLVVSGAYLPSAQTDTSLTLRANPRYWAGAPAIGTIALTTDLGGRSPVEVFQAGDIDFTPLSSSDASWIRYDRELGPQLRRAEDFSVTYYGFDTTTKPFSDPLVRQAFAAAVDWHRLVTLDDDTTVPATSLVPAGIAGRGSQDFSPVHDPDKARTLLAQAGYPGGAGFPTVALVTSGTPYDQAVVDELKRTLGVNVELQEMPFDDYSARLDTHPPQMWALDWIADYPHPQDFLGLLLGSGSPSNVGHWSDPAFDAALAAAAATDDPAAQEAAYTTAQRIVQDQAPVIPLRYGESWDLARAGLLGAGRSGVGIVRYAGLAWDKP